MLTTPDNLFLHLLRDDIQNELFDHLSRDGGEADQPVVCWDLLLALFEYWSDIGFPQSSGTSVIQDLSKLMESGSAMTSTLVGALNQDPWICWCPVCLNDLSPNPSQPRECHPFSRLSLLPSESRIPDMLVVVLLAYII